MVKFLRIVSIKPKKIDLKYIFLSLLVLIIVAAAGYKYWEWNFLNSLSAQYNNTWTEELQLNESMGKTSNELDQYIRDNYEEGPTDEKIDKSLSKIKLLIDQGEHYYSTTQNNQKAYQRLLSQVNLLFGKERSFADELIKLQLAYYESDLQASREGLAIGHFIYDFFTVGREGLTFKDFQDNANGDEGYYADHLGDIVVLKKYTDDGYKFPHQDEIKKYVPKGYDLLEKYKNFYATFYSVMEDYAKGDKESAQYKSGKLQEYAVALNIDIDEILKDTLEKGNERIKKNVENVTKQFLLIKSFEKNGPRYPLLPAINGYESDLVMCSAYYYKTTSVYFDIMDTYPKAKNTNDLLRDLRTVSPSTEKADKLFDKKALKLTNTDKKISFVCSNHAKDKKFVFETSKNETK